MAKQVSVFLANFLGKEHSWKRQLLEQWESIIGSLRDKVRIEKIDGTVLVLGVVHPSWAQELTFLSDQLKGKINDALGEERIKELRFKTIERVPISLRSIKSYSVHTVPYEEVTRDAREEKTLQKIKDAEMRQVFAAYYNRCHALRKSPPS